MDDQELAFAILMALPGSYDPLVQSYRLSVHKDSASSSTPSGLSGDGGTPLI
jgi:hypothetical protein